MAGALSGALRGIDAVPADLFASVKAVNHEDIETISAGLTAIAWGDQLRQARLDEIIFLGTLGLDLLPQPPEGGSEDGLVTNHPAIATEYGNA